MSFETQFPNLTDSKAPFTKAELVVYCLDKQIVKETIIACMKDWEENNGEYEDLLDGKALLERLRL